MTKEEFIKQLYQVVEESEKLESDALMIKDTADFLASELDKLEIELDDPNLPFDKREKKMIQMEQLINRMAKEIDILTKEEEKLLNNIKKFNTLKENYEKYNIKRCKSR